MIYNSNLVINLGERDYYWLDSSSKHKIFEILEIPHSEDKIVFLDWIDSETNRFNNIVRCDKFGKIKLQASLPSGSDWDAYTSIKSIDDGYHIEAYSWSGFSVKIDSINGRVYSSYFVK